MAYWLLKTEPSTYSFDNLVADGTTRWDGVRNPLALKHIRSMAKGDRAMIYHSGNEKAVVGMAEVTRAPYPDPKIGNPMMVVIDIRVKARLTNNVSLAAIKKRKEFASFELVRISRLSVMPVMPKMWKLLMSMASGEKRLQAARS
ncbi:MAG: EVE domain-containing protein [Ignavibacteriae bacterium]|nr:EVE domain-containing protein [Ignavibacteria bacterium]MBI3365744.1 EVE domain-containing protein [Ignavibacteriota bacterium]